MRSWPGISWCLAVCWATWAPSRPSSVNLLHKNGWNSVRLRTSPPRPLSVSCRCWETRSRSVLGTLTDYPPTTSVWRMVLLSRSPDVGLYWLTPKFRPTSGSKRWNTIENLKSSSWIPLTFCALWKTLSFLASPCCSKMFKRSWTLPLTLCSWRLLTRKATISISNLGNRMSNTQRTSSSTSRPKCATRTICPSCRPKWRWSTSWSLMKGSMTSF